MTSGSTSFREKVGGRALLTVHRSGDRAHWKRLPIVPVFRRSPDGFVPALSVNWMTTVWWREGAAGYNFWTMAMPDASGSSGRYNPDHPLFGAWVCIYLVRSIPRSTPLFGLGAGMVPEPRSFLPLSEADQKAWLAMMGADSPEAEARVVSEPEPSAVGERQTVRARIRMKTRTDVGPGNPESSPLTPDFRSPHRMPQGISEGTFLPRESQWKGKISPYQEIEYTVDGYPLALPEHGLCAYLFYAGVRYRTERGKEIDNFKNVKEAASPILEEGIDFVRK